MVFVCPAIKRMEGQMILTESNYHSEQSASKYLLASSIKHAKKCEYGFLHPQKKEPKSAFIAGHLFELLVTNDLNGVSLLYENHPEMVSSQGITKGQLKTEFRDAAICSERVRNQDFIRNLIDMSDKQMILTGKILGEPVRMMCDLVCNDWIVDLKTAKDFKRVWSEENESYVEWWQGWNYPMQLWIYKEIARQNGITINHTGLIGVSKSNYDISCIEFSDEVMEQAKADVLYVVGRIKDIKNGAEPYRCEKCPACIESKKIEEFMVC